MGDARDDLARKRRKIRELQKKLDKQREQGTQPGNQGSGIGASQAESSRQAEARYAESFDVTDDWYMGDSEEADNRRTDDRVTTRARARAQQQQQAGHAEAGPRERQAVPPQPQEVSEEEEVFIASSEEDDDDPHEFPSDEGEDDIPVHEEAPEPQDVPLLRASQNLPQQVLPQPHEAGRWYPIEDDPDLAEVKVQVYEGAEISVLDSHLLLSQVMVTHNLTKAAMDDILAVMSAHLPRLHQAPKTEEELRIFFGSVEKQHVVTHNFCSSCFKILDATLPACTSCPQLTDTRGFNNKFLEFPVEVALRKKYKDINFLKAIRYPFERQVQEGHISDILDGSEYRKHALLQEFGNVSFMFNTDGVSVFKSDHQELWPVYLVINELPPSLRFKKQNMILLGAWFGKTKPQFNTFLAPIARRLLWLKNGLEVQTHNFHDLAHPLAPAELRSVTIKAVVINGTMDNPAKDGVFGKVGHGAKEGCFCNEKGESTQSTKKKVVYHPYREGEQWMTQEEYVATAYTAMLQGNPVNGFKSICFLSILDYVSYIAPIDYMHTVCLGVVKKMLFIWTSTERGSRRPYRIEGGQVLMLDRLISEITPPSFLSRSPRSLTDRNHWKASEYRAWLLYYSPILLQGVLPAAYYEHWMSFVNAITDLLSCSISPAMLHRAEQDLRSFYKNFNTLYDRRYLSINFHAIKHLPTLVVKYGPLWATSCFGFESMNHFLRKGIHGTGAVLSQLSSPEFLLGKIPSFVRPEDLSAQTCETLKSMGATFGSGLYSPPLPPLVHIRDIPGGIKLVGKAVKPGLVGAVTFNRAITDGVLLQGTAYTRSRKKKNSAIAYKEDGEIKYANIAQFHLLDGAVLVTASPLRKLFPNPLDVPSRGRCVLVEEGKEVIIFNLNLFVGPCLLVKSAQGLFANMAHHHLEAE